MPIILVIWKKNILILNSSDMKQRLSYIILLASLLLTVISCNRSDSSTAGLEELDSSPTVVMLVSSFGLGDFICEDRIVSAAIKAAQDNGLKSRIITPLIGESGPDVLIDDMNRCHGDGIKRLYIICSPDFLKYLEYIAASVPEGDDIDLLFIGPDPHIEDVKSADICTYGLYYLAGCLVSRLLPEEYGSVSCGYYEANPSYEYAATGFRDAISANSNAWIDFECYNDPGMENASNVSSWTDSYDLNYGGYDFILHLLDTYIKTVLICCPEAIQNYLGIGIDMDFSLYSDKIVLSCVREYELLVNRCITQWLSPAGLPDSQCFGLDSEYTRLVLSPGYRYLEPAADSLISQAIDKEREWQAHSPEDDFY